MMEPVEVLNEVTPEVDWLWIFSTADVAAEVAAVVTVSGIAAKACS
jgi:hypothetical protein